MENEKQVLSSTGCGSLLIHNESVLLVQLNYGKFKGHWILPGGMIQANEAPHQAAIRETKEETGVDIVIQKLIAIRYRSFGDKANNYWVFKAQAPLTQQLTQLVWPKEELQEARMWPVKEALNESAIRPMTQMYIQMLTQPKSDQLKLIELPKDHPNKDYLYGYVF